MPDLPDDVLSYLTWVAFKDADEGEAAALLRKYPKSQPEPAWQDRDVVLFDRDPFIVGLTCKSAPFAAELIARGGRRVHPARFHDHAEYLRECAKYLKSEMRARNLEAIADDIDPEVSRIIAEDDAEWEEMEGR